MKNYSDLNDTNFAIYTTMMALQQYFSTISGLMKIRPTQHWFVIEKSMKIEIVVSFDNLG